MHVLREMCLLKRRTWRRDPSRCLKHSVRRVRLLDGAAHGGKRSETRRGSAAAARLAASQARRVDRSEDDQEPEQQQQHYTQS
eukprot:7376784-Prymnesium_polylepis.1